MRKMARNTCKSQSKLHSKITTQVIINYKKTIEYLQKANLTRNKINYIHLHTRRKKVSPSTTNEGDQDKYLQ